MVTARQKPKMVLIVPSLHDNTLHLDAPGMDTLKLPAEIKCTNREVLRFKYDLTSVPFKTCVFLRVENINY